MATPASYYVYFGTSTAPGEGFETSQGIYVYKLDVASGELTPLHVVEGIANPGYVFVHPNGENLYSVSEVGQFEGKPTGAVTAFALDRSTGALSPLNHEASGGRGPCHLSVTPDGKHVLVANYGQGSVGILPIEEGGRVGSVFAIQHEGTSVDPKRQEGPHAHCFMPSPDSKFALAADLGLDKVLVYRITDDSKLEPHDPPFTKSEPGVGPRQLMFHPNGKWLYLINEMGNTFTAYNWDAAAGTLSEINTLSTLPDDWEGTSHTSAVRVHPNGKFVYGSNRGHDSIAIYVINEDSGELSLVDITPTHGSGPRDFNIDPSGQWLICGHQAGDNVEVFAVDSTTGKLSHKGKGATVPRAICVQFLEPA